MRKISKNALMLGALACAPGTGCGSDGSDGRSGMLGEVAGAAGTSANVAGGGGATGAGEPIVAEDHVWTAVDFPDTQCRDGSMSRLAVRLDSSSKDVVIELEAAAPCWDADSCASPWSPSTATTGAAETDGFFDRTHAENPVRDWNHVLVPDCTGDGHLGTKEDGSIPGLSGTQHFVGRRNLEAFLPRIVATFPDASRVLLSGSSAGGFAAWGNVELVQRAFGSTPVSLIAASGPPLDSPYFPACVQDLLRTTFGYDDSVLKDCGADCPNPDDYFADYTEHLAKLPGNQLYGVISSTFDPAVAALVGSRGTDCTSTSGSSITPESYEAGVLDFRARVQALGSRFGTFYIAAEGHYGPGEGLLYTTELNGTRMVDWATDIINGVAARHVGP